MYIYDVPKYEHMKKVKTIGEEKMTGHLETEQNQIVPFENVDYLDGTLQTAKLKTGGSVKPKIYSRAKRNFIAWCDNDNCIKVES